MRGRHVRRRVRNVNDDDLHRPLPAEPRVLATDGARDLLQRRRAEVIEISPVDEPYPAIAAASMRVDEPGRTHVSEPRAEVRGRAERQLGAENAAYIERVSERAHLPLRIY